MADHRPSNPIERACFDALQAEGLRVLRRGWPDLIAFDCHGGIVAVEAKRDGQGLRHEQAEILSELAGIGVRCFVYTPSSQFEPYGQKRSRSAPPQFSHVPA